MNSRYGRRGEGELLPRAEKDTFEFDISPNFVYDVLFLHETAIDGGGFNPDFLLINAAMRVTRGLFLISTVLTSTKCE